MPSPELFDELLARRHSCDKFPDPDDNYLYAVEMSALVDRATYGTDAYEKEVYDYTRYLLAALDADQDLTSAQRDEIAGKIHLMVTYNSCFDESIVHRAFDDHEAEKTAQSGAE